eukprot:gene6751-4843_t
MGRPTGTDCSVFLYPCNEASHKDGSERDGGGGEGGGGSRTIGVHSPTCLCAKRQEFLFLMITCTHWCTPRRSRENTEEGAPLSRTVGH